MSEKATDDEDKKPEEQVDITIVQQETVEIREGKGGKENKKKLKVKLEKKTTWRVHGLMGVKNPKKLEEIINKILSGEYKLIK